MNLKDLYQDPKYKYIITNFFNRISKFSTQDIIDILNHTDLEIYAILNKILLNNISKTDLIQKRNLESIKKLDSYIDLIINKLNTKNKRILDIGTEDCYFIDKLNEFNTAFGINIKSNYSYHTNKKCIKIYNGTNIPFKSNSLNLVTIFMVLHHITDISKRQKLLQDIKRVLKKDGFLLIKEHDVQTAKEEYLINFIHYFYELSYNDTYNIKYYNNYSVKYMRQSQLHNILSKLGFKDVSFMLDPRTTTPNPVTKTYFSLFQK